MFQYNNTPYKCTTVTGMGGGGIWNHINLCYLCKRFVSHMQCNSTGHLFIKFIRPSNSIVALGSVQHYRQYENNIIKKQWSWQSNKTYNLK